ncbi:MAG: hypothetical protein A3E78_12280 [Alphaproteobacteria bacterium RIFCSPHIGHO2_12_FULL_63_12]|nr:MAG: hypothetical protein A3E78_12280 [Alphaproteobacteria bacterium RIFCSPHIGHO2_12_FULL_63_12]
MRSAVLHVRGTPRPKQSARFANGRVISIVAARALLKAWTASIKKAGTAWARAGNVPLDGALRCDIDFYFATPKAERHGKPHTHRPDIDNLAKAALDSMRGIVFSDDSKVSSGLVSKWWAAEAGAVIVVREIAGHTDDIRDDDDDLGAQQVDAPDGAG